VQQQRQHQQTANAVLSQNGTAQLEQKVKDPKSNDTILVNYRVNVGMSGRNMAEAANP